jgi:DNA repair protein RecN (Recombination protein N)
MLQELSIKHFAIIDDLRIRFSEGLTILTGETGAGKSIIINAVNLLLGSRASARLIRSKCDTAELEALFRIEPDSRAARIMQSHDYHPSDGLLIRRIISRNNRHRVYINGRLATTQILNEIAENMASIAGQHAHQGLLKEEEQLLILDQFGGCLPLRSKVEDLYRKLQPLIRKRADLQKMQQRQTERLELLSYQKDEIEQAAIVPGEDQVLEQERTRLKHADMLHRTVHAGIDILYAGEGAIVERLVTVQKDIEKAAQIDTGLTDASEQLTDVAFRLEDITEKLRDYLSGVTHDNTLLEATEARLDTLNKLKRKYGETLEDILAGYDRICRELAEMETLEERIGQTEAQLAQQHHELARQARRLSEKIKTAARRIARRVESELALLAMPHTRFEAALEPIPCHPDTPPYLTLEGNLITASGLEQVVFKIAPNPGETLKPLSEIASGGELSRMVLALKAILASRDSLEMIVFDEVDAGIGGGVAERVGRKIASLARFHQIICITHQAQIAKFGDYHFKISKAVSDGSTRTLITELTQQERVKEIARMLGGIEITTATLNHAREMLDQRQQSLLWDTESN